VFGARFLDDLAPVLFAALAWGIGRGLLARVAWRWLFWIGAGWSLVLFNAAALAYDQKWDTDPVNVNFHPEKLLDWSDPQWLAVLRGLPNGGVRTVVAFALSLFVVALLLRLEGLWPRRLSSKA
jgi:MFS family permease